MDVSQLAGSLGLGGLAAGVVQVLKTAAQFPDRWSGVLTLGLAVALSATAAATGNLGPIHDGFAAGIAGAVSALAIHGGVDMAQQVSGTQAK